MSKKATYSKTLAALRIIHNDKNNFYSERVKKLTADDIVDVVNAYLQNIEELESLKSEKQKRESTNQISEKDIGWFPGDGCD